MPPSSVAARSLALAVIGVGAASFAALGQNVTAFNPYSGAGLTGGPLPQYTSPPTAPAADAVGSGPVVGPAFNPWSSRNPALASRPATPPQTSAPARQTKAAASLPPPPPGPIKSRVVAVPELTTSRSKSRNVEKAGAAPAAKSASTPAAPTVVAPAPVPAAPAPVAVAPPAPAATPAAPPPVAAVPAPPPARPAPAPTTAPTAPSLAAPMPAPAPPAAAAPPPQPPAVEQRQMAALAPAPSPPPGPPARSSVAVTLVFTARSTELSDASKVELDRLAKDVVDRTLRQVELRSVSENSDPDSRKISLARALIVRNYLIDKGVRSRIEIAAIVGGGGERVEILVPST
jgi:outer membrane protein OmpA-like peptidoglycan-associated protein